MKRFLLTNLLILLILTINIQLFAQKDKKEKDKTVKLKIEKIENGKKTVTDTTFTLKKGEDLNKILEQNGVNTEKSGSYNVRIETDDSLKHGENKRVWIKVGDTGAKEKVIITKDGKSKKVMITDDDEMEIMGDDEMVISSGNSGDSIKHIKKIIHINDANGNGKEDTVIIFEKSKYKEPKHKKIEKVYKFSNDSAFNGNNSSFFFSDKDDEFNKVFINQDNNDSINVVIIKKLKGDMNEPFDFDFDNDFNWKDEHNIVFPGKFNHKMAKASIDDATETDLNLIRLSKGYKKLDLKDFIMVLDGFAPKINLSFTTEEKGDLSVKIYDEKGNAYLVMELKDFKGKFDKEIEIDRGNNILQITQNKKQYIRELKIK
jgi:hypothetical protein